MLSQEKLLKIINEEIGRCHKGNHGDVGEVTKPTVILMPLLQHREMAETADNDQVKIEAVVLSLETNSIVNNIRRWRIESGV